MSEENTPKKKKGNFFTNLLFTEEETTESTESTESTGPVSDEEMPTMASAPVHNFNVQVTGDGAFDKTFSDSFHKLIADNNIQGIDYFEFAQALKGMSGIAGQSESVNFQSVFNILKVSDATLTKDKLISSVEHYVGILKSEEAAFKSEMDLSVKEEIVSRREKAESLADENKELIQKIQEINDKIQKNNEDILSLNSEAAGAEAKIGQTHKNFITTLAHVISGLETDKEKINQLIKE